MKICFVDENRPKIMAKPAGFMLVWEFVFTGIVRIYRDRKRRGHASSISFYRHRFSYCLFINWVIRSDFSAVVFERKIKMSRSFFRRDCWLKSLVNKSISVDVRSLFATVIQYFLIFRITESRWATTKFRHCL